MFITALTTARHLSLFWASLIESMPHPISRNSILMLSSNLRLGLPSPLLPSGSPLKTCIRHTLKDRVIQMLDKSEDGIDSRIWRAFWMYEARWMQTVYYGFRTEGKPTSRNIKKELATLQRWRMENFLFCTFTYIYDLHGNTLHRLQYMKTPMTICLSHYI